MQVGTKCASAEGGQPSVEGPSYAVKLNLLMNTLQVDEPGEVSSPSRRSFTAQSLVAEPPATLPVTRSQLSRTLEMSQDESIEDLLRVDDGGKRRIDELLLGMTGAVRTRETTPRGTKRQGEAMTFELEEIFKEAKEDRKRKRLAKAVAGSSRRSDEAHATLTAPKTGASS